MAGTRPWGIADLQEFFNREGAKKGNSKEFQAVVDALGDYSRLQGNTVSEESAMDLVEANDKLLKACETYAKERKGAIFSAGKKRLDAVTRLTEFQKGMNLDELRDLRVVRQHEGKTWRQVGQIPVAEVTVDGKGEIVGANVSERMKVELNGRVGFFTAERVIVSPEKSVERMVEREKDPARKKLLEESKGFLTELMRGADGDHSEVEGKVFLADDKKQWHSSLKDEITARIDKLDSQLQEREGGFFDQLGAAKEKKALNGLLKDEGLIQSCVDEYGKMAADYIARSQVILDQDKGHKLVANNIATSRMAELLGIGNIAAHSEKMVVHQGNQVMTGCFMEFAEGMDSRSNDYATQAAINQVDFKPNPSMNRDMATLEAFDFLCGQGDRHGGNMFYKLSEPDENGKRNITGLQGIDNDLAFGDRHKDHKAFGWRFGWQNIENMYFIDKDLAQKVRGLDRRKLEFALGDILTKEQIDSTMERVQVFQERLEKDMVEIEPDGWNLDKYNEADYGKDLEGSGLDKAGKNYVRGLRDMADDAKRGQAANHKYGQILYEMSAHKNEFEKAEKTQDELYGDMHSMFEASEQKAEERDKARQRSVQMKAEENTAKAERLRAKAEEIRAKVEREKTGQPKAKTDQPKRERISFADLGGKKTQGAAKKTGMSMEGHMERQTERTAGTRKLAGAGMKR